MKLQSCPCGARVYVARKHRSTEMIALTPTVPVYRLIETTEPKGLRAEPMPQSLEGHTCAFLIEHRCGASHSDGSLT